jgi:16S rRNA (uracil1498-N3)-methyltransferase
VSAVPEEGAAVRRDASALVFVDDLVNPRPSEDDLHHLRDVLRLDAGEQVICSDGRGSWRSYEVTGALAATRGSHGRSRGVVGEGEQELFRALGSIVEEAAPEPRLAVGFPLLKGDRTEWTVQKLTELGIDVITPFLTARSVVRLDGAAARRRGERLRRVAREAAAQSRRVFLPEVDDPMPLAVLDVSGVAFAEPGGALLVEATTTVFVGPEGGWSAEELGRSATTVTLGSGVLRAETAALVAGVLLGARRSGLHR